MTHSTTSQARGFAARDGNRLPDPPAAEDAPGPGEAGWASETEPLTPQDAWAMLLAGHERYLADPARRRRPEAADALGGRRAPYAALVCCADSFGAPELLFDAEPGQIFVVQVAGNIVASEGLASLEYAVAVLGVSVILVLGHSGCGAVDAALKVRTRRVELPGTLPQLVDSILPQLDPTISPDDTEALVVQNVLRVADTLALPGTSAVLAARLADRAVEIGAGFHDVATGTIRFLRGSEVG